MQLEEREDLRGRLRRDEAQALGGAEHVPAGIERAAMPGAEEEGGGDGRRREDAEDRHLGSKTLP
jgi:hypothetical protein